MPHIRLVQISTVAGLALVPFSGALADVVPLTVTRSVGLAPTISHAFGPYTQSFTDHESGGTSSQPANMSVTVSQDSFITDGTTSPFVTYTGSVSEGGSGGPSANFAQGNTTLTLLFQLTTPETLIHTFPVGPNRFTCQLTPLGQSAINLLAAGQNNLALAAGNYTLSIVGSGLAASNTASATFNFSGTVTLIPSPGAALPLLGCSALVGLRRRRR